MQKVPLLIDNEFVESATADWLDVVDPSNQNVIAQVPLALPDEVDRAVAVSKNAFHAWKDVPVSERARYLFKYQSLLKENKDELAKILSEENGKTFADAQGDVWRGVEVVEYACGIASQMMGETVENVARDIDTYSYLQPMGVFAGITPFNFPAMIPLWMFPLAVACGNTFVLKPSEQDPLTPMRLAELFVEAGFPKGVLSVVHGTRPQVEQLLEHSDIRGVSFVGSAHVGQHVYKTGCANLKRVQAMVGAKNHMVVMPDADMDQVVNSVAGASCGAAGQRCMAISVCVLVGDANSVVPRIKDGLAKLKPGVWNDENAAFGPMVSVEAKERVLSLISRGKEEGAELLLDGSDCKVEGYPDGNWIGPTIFFGVTAEMSIYREEIFGPVLLVVQVDNLDEAISFINENPFGNGTSIFTNSGAAGRRFQHEIEVGQVGINIPIPVPLPFFSFTGWKGSFYGDQHAYGKHAVRFYTETKTVTVRWFDTDHIADSSRLAPEMTIKLK